MANAFQKVLTWVADHFSKDASKMLIFTGVAGWTLSSLAQIGAILFNPKISKEQKSFLVPQELADAAVNIGSFFLITQVTKKTVSKLFSTGKFAPQSVRDFFNKNKNLYGDRIGKVDFDIDEVIKVTKNFPKENYWTVKNYFTTLATVGAGIVSSNVVTPIVRNKMASKMQKNYLQMNKKDLDNQTQPTFKSSVYFSNGMKI